MKDSSVSFGQQQKTLQLHHTVCYQNVSFRHSRFESLGNCDLYMGRCWPEPI